MRQLLKMKNQQALTTGDIIDKIKVKSYLSGWLLLFYLWLITTSISIYSVLMNNIDFMNSNDYLNITTESSSFFHPLWSTYFIGEVTLISIGLPLIALILILTIMRSSRTPVFVLIFLCYAALINLFSMLLSVYIESDLSGALSESSINTILKFVIYIIVVTVWSLYWRKSIRVRQTFKTSDTMIKFKSDILPIRIVMSLVYSSFLFVFAFSLIYDVYYIKHLIIFILSFSFFMHSRSKIMN